MEEHAPECMERRGKMLYGEDKGPGTAPYLGETETVALADEIVRRWNAFPELLEACKRAWKNSCKRSEGRGKWTCGDQNAHDALAAAIAQANPKQREEESWTR